MKPLIGLLSCLIVAGCSHTAPPPAIETPLSFAEIPTFTCEQVYSHIVDLGVQQANGERLLSYEQREFARKQVDDRYREDGATGRFYSYCRTHATQQHLSCAMQAETLHSIDLCFAP